MVPVIMAVGVFVFQRFVCVLVSVALCQMQPHSGQHERPTQQHQPTR